MSQSLVKKSLSAICPEKRRKKNPGCKVLEKIKFYKIVIPYFNLIRDLQKQFPMREMKRANFRLLFPKKTKSRIQKYSF